MADLRRGSGAVAEMVARNGAVFGIGAGPAPATAEKHGLAPGTPGLVPLPIGTGAIVSFPVAGRFADQPGAARVAGLSAAEGACLAVAVARCPVAILGGVQAMEIAGLAGALRRQVAGQ